MSDNTIKSYMLLGLLVVLFFQLPVTYKVNIHDLDRNDFVKMMYYKYVEVVLDMADSDDTIILNIDSHGGAVSTGMAMVNKILTTKAHTIANIESAAYSAGAVIATACDEIRATKYSEILFHKARTYDMLGKATIVDLPMADNFAEDVYLNYLTETERKSYYAGEDVTIDGREFAKRFNSRSK